jgi:hypothetical protein
MRTSMFIYVVLNIAGLGLYLICVQGIVDSGPPGYWDFFDGVAFAFTALPVLAASCLLNLGWGIKALVDILRRRNYHAAAAGGVAVVAWTLLVLVERWTT